MSQIRTAFIETPRMTFHCRIHGDEDGLPMLLLHGSFASSRWWEPFLNILPNEILAVVPDLRGCGQSDKSETGYAIEEQAEDVWALVQALEWDEFDLAGHSSGGAIAMEFALQHMERLHSLILVDSAPAEGVFTPVDAYVLLERMKTDSGLLREGLKVLMPTWHDDEGNPERRRFLDQLVEDAQQMAPAAFTAIADALGRWNRFHEVRHLTLPTLLIWGDQDEIVDRDATTRTLIAIPGATNLEILRQVGHSPMIEAPVALAERMIDFITDEFEEYAAIREMAEDGE